jgi:hypothetical protein
MESQKGTRMIFVKFDLVAVFKPQDGYIDVLYHTPVGVMLIQVCVN